MKFGIIGKLVLSTRFMLKSDAGIFIVGIF